MDKLNEIITNSPLVLVDFYATWCGPCQKMHPILEDLKEEMGAAIRIIKLDVDKNQSIAEQYRVQSVPTLMLYKDGKVVWRQSGAQPLHELKAVIEMYG